MEEKTNNNNHPAVNEQKTLGCLVIKPRRGNKLGGETGAIQMGREWRRRERTSEPT